MISARTDCVWCLVVVGGGGWWCLVVGGGHLDRRFEGCMIGCRKVIVKQ